MPRTFRNLLVALLCAPLLFIATSAAAMPLKEPLRFFEGRTESVGTLKAVMRKPLRVRTIGSGTIEPDGSLTLIQHVQDEGQPPHTRTWRIRQVAPGKFTGTMSGAVGPVTIEQVNGAYRFNFKIAGGFPSSNGCTRSRTASPGRASSW